MSGACLCAYECRAYAADKVREHALVLLSAVLRQPQELSPEVAAKQLEEAVFAHYAEPTPSAESAGKRRPQVRVESLPSAYVTILNYLFIKTSG